jgi:hypothetical protein
MRVVNLWSGAKVQKRVLRSMSRCASTGVYVPLWIGSDLKTVEM